MKHPPVLPPMAIVALAFLPCAPRAHATTAIASSQEIHVDSQWVRAQSATLRIDSRTEVHLTLSDSPHGTLTGSGAYPPNTTVTVTATPAPGYAFTRWTGQETGSANPLELLMDDDKQIGALFEPDLSDLDGDGLSHFLEATVYGTHPNLPDTDGDQLSDSTEILSFAGSYHPLKTDTDGDGTPDGLEDFDGDRLTNAQELLSPAQGGSGSDPTLPDSNHDGLTDFLAIRLGRNPMSNSSDLVKILQNARSEFALHSDDDVIDLRVRFLRISQAVPKQGNTLELRAEIEQHTQPNHWTRIGDAIYQETFPATPAPIRYYRIALPELPAR